MSKSKRTRRRNRIKPTTIAAKPVGKAPFRYMLWVIIPLVPVIAALWIFRGEHHGAKTPTSAPASISRIELPLLSLPSDGLSAEAQVARLHGAAIELGQGLVTAFAQEAEAYVLLGNTHRQLGQSKQAVAHWQRALQLNPQRADVYTFLAILEEEKGNQAQALALWQKVLSLQPTRAGLRDSLANTLMSLNQWDRAQAVLTEELNYSPQSPRTHYLLGQTFMQRQAWAEAVTHYEKTLALDPNWTRAYYALATALTRSGRRQAAQHYRSLFRQRSQTPQELAGDGFTDQGDLLKAKQTLASLSIGAADLVQAQAQNSLVLALLKQAATLIPADQGTRKRLAAHYRAQGRFKEALAECEQIARLAPRDATSQMLIGSLSLQLRQYTKAESAFKRMIKLAPESSVGYRELARIYLNAREQATQARSLAQQAVAREPSAENHFVLGQAHHHNGDTDSALQAVQQAVQLDPLNQDYQRVYHQLRIGK